MSGSESPSNSPCCSSTTSEYLPSPRSAANPPSRSRKRTANGTPQNGTEPKRPNRSQTPEEMCSSNEPSLTATTPCEDTSELPHTYAEKRQLHPVRAIGMGAKTLQKYKIVIPQEVPDYIPKDRVGEYFQKVALKQIEPWQFNSEVDELDLRSDDLSHICSSNYVLISTLLRNVVKALRDKGVFTIKLVRLPALHIDSGDQLFQVLEGFLADNPDTQIEGKFHVEKLTIDVQSKLGKGATTNWKIDELSELLRQRNVKGVIVVSRSQALETFTSALKAKMEYPFECTKSKPQPAPRKRSSSILSCDVSATRAIPFNTLLEELDFRHDTKKTGIRDKQSTTSRIGMGSEHRTLTHGSSPISTSKWDQQHGSIVTQTWNIEQYHNANIDGKEICIAILSSGVSLHHATFCQAVIDMQNFVPGEDLDLTTDSACHGTMCASIACGRGFLHPVTKARTKTEARCKDFPPGVAPGAKLRMCKVTSSSAADPDHVVEALEYLEHIHKSGQTIHVLCIPMGSTAYHKEIANQISMLQSLGIIIICAAGNVAKEGIAYPARLGNVLCIGACDKNGARNSFSPIGQEIHFLAPGSDVWGAGTATPWKVGCASGTAYASAAVAGLCCLILQHIRDTSKTNRFFDNIDTHVMKEILKSMSTLHDHHSEKEGYGCLDPARFFIKTPEEIERMLLKIIQDS